VRPASSSSSRDNNNDADPDVPIPSIEPRHYSPASESVTTARSSTTMMTPLSTPPPNTSRPPTLPRDSSLGIGEAFGQIQLTGPGGLADLSGLGAALNDVARGSDGRAASLDPTSANGSHLSPGAHNRSRRQSRSRRSTSVSQQPHNVREEEPPPDAFHKPSFQAAFQGTKAAMASLSIVLGSGPAYDDQESRMLALQRDANRLAQFQCPSKRTVGLVGESGAGLSTNSL
jgi:hypothetical protein